MTPLSKLREQIDETDAQLVALLNRRAALALEVKRAKQQDRLSIYAPERERQIIDRVLALSKDGPFPPEPLERIFINIISVTRSLIGDISVAFLGPEYSLEHEAGLQQFGEEVQYLPEPNIEKIFAKVAGGEALFGVVPLRNSSGALIALTFEQLIESPLTVVSEVETKERLALFSKAGALSDIQRVYSSAYFFSRCQSWLTANLPDAELLLQNTFTGGVRNLDSELHSALVASQSLGERFSLVSLAAGIQDSVDCGSRFVIIGRKGAGPSGNDKTSLVCSIKDRAGALRDILRPFSERGVTLLRIESRPIVTRAWEYVFFIELAGHQDDPAVTDAVAELRAAAVYLKILGSYPLVCHA